MAASTASEKLAPSADPSRPSSLANAPALDDNTQQEPNDLPHGARLVAILLSLILALFLVSLDNTILGTAIPKITDEFHDLSKVSWYGSAYFMTFGGFQSSWGKLFKYLPIKPWYLVAVCIFEIGSLICAVSKDPTALIVGRAIAGVGGAGLIVGTFTLAAMITTREKRPQVNGYLGATYGVAAVLGPIIGGAFTDRVSWRWCFYINLPIGGLALGCIAIFFVTPMNAAPVRVGWKETLLQLDLVGVTLMMGLLISFILALQYGGQTHAWSSSVVIGLLVGFVLILAAFIVWEIYQKERAMIVKRIFVKRYVAVGSLFMFFFGGAYFTVLYYLPIYFQSVFGSSPIGSGVKMLAFIIPLIITIILQGAALSAIGIVPVFWIIGSAVATIGCGLFYTMGIHTSTGKWIGYQLIVGSATGITFQTSLSNAQVHAAPEDMSQITAIINFFVAVGGSFFISAAQSAFNNQLIAAVTHRLPDINPMLVLGTGATQIRQVFTSTQVPIIIDSYMVGLRSVFGITIAAFGISTIIGSFGSWKRLHKEALKDVAGGGG